MNKKGIVFSDTMIALIIGIVVVISIIIGGTMAFNSLKCYTGLKWLSESPGVHVGTMANSKILLSIDGPVTNNYTSCSQRCEGKYTECISESGSSGTATCNGGCISTNNDCNSAKTNCLSKCESMFNKALPNRNYAYFDITIMYKGITPAALNVSESQTSTSAYTLLWYTTTNVLEQGDVIKVSTQSYPVNELYKCMITIHAEPVGVRGVLAAETNLSANDVKLCLIS